MGRLGDQLIVYYSALQAGILHYGCGVGSWVGRGRVAGESRAGRLRVCRSVYTPSAPPAENVNTTYLDLSAAARLSYRITQRAQAEQFTLPL